ncbi:DEP domain-containing mTOR-interacting protein-like [Amphiura filiformis]|uniref:DEP domain-containing mTOR-interacting protein-like n=1 Tax=Amphiura filiformis TaxID=82378 RepID=UPI003B21BDF3
MLPRRSVTTIRTSSTASIGSKITGNILMIGERLRQAFHNNKPAIVRDRRQLLRQYTQCFTGREAVDWMVTNRDIIDRGLAVKLLRILQRNNVLHHVSDQSYLFKDDNALYRFRLDDCTFPMSREKEPYIKGEQLYARLTSQLTKNTILKVHTESGTVYEKSFYGSELVQWVVKHGLAASRAQAIGLGKELVECDIIRHVTTGHHFKDERVLYQFHPNMAHLKVMDLFDLDERPRSLNQDSPMSLRRHSEVSPRHSPIRTPNSIDIALGPLTLEPTSYSGDENKNIRKSSPGSSDSSSPLPPRVRKISTGSRSMSPVRTRGISSDEEYMVKNTIKITGDSVGFGFVVRGEGPSYVHTVDPAGPAAAAGLKAKQYITAVNSVDVVHKKHQELAHIILKNPYYITLDVVDHNPLPKTEEEDED